MDLIYKDPDNIRNNKCIDNKPVANPLDEMKKNQVELRKARKEDAGFIAHVVMVAMGYNVFDKEVAANGTSPLGKLSDILAALTDICAREDTLYSYRNTDIALFNGQVAGALVSYNEAITKSSRREHSPLWPNLWEFLRWNLERRREKANIIWILWQSCQSSEVTV